MGSTASAVRNWHGFAWHIKGYNPEATLPPRNERQVAQWICLFRNYGTAMNYLCSLKWTCIKHELDVSWYGGFLKTLMKGQKKWSMKMIAGEIDKQRLLTEEIVSDLVRFCDMMSESDFGTFVLFCWEFLCRVQSEAVPLEVGRSTDEVMLPEGRHSGVYIEGNDICVRWMRRKKHAKGLVFASWVHMHHFRKPWSS